MGAGGHDDLVALLLAQAIFAQHAALVFGAVAAGAVTALAEGFARDNIFVWSGHNYAIEPVSRMGLMDKGGVLRVGLAHYNTDEEVDAFLSSLTRQIRNA